MARPGLRMVNRPSASHGQVAVDAGDAAPATPSAIPWRSTAKPMPSWSEPTINAGVYRARHTSDATTCADAYRGGQDKGCRRSGRRGLQSSSPRLAGGAATVCVIMVAAAARMAGIQRQYPLGRADWFDSRTAEAYYGHLDLGHESGDDSELLHFAEITTIMLLGHTTSITRGGLTTTSAWDVGLQRAAHVRLRHNFNQILQLEHSGLHARMPCSTAPMVSTRTSAGACKAAWYKPRFSYTHAEHIGMWARNRAHTDADPDVALNAAPTTYS